MARRNPFASFRARPDIRAELDAELTHHFEETIAALVERGWSEHEAKLEAERRFGDVDRYRATLEKIGHARNNRIDRLLVFDMLRHNLQLAWRGLSHAPGFTLAIVLTLGLGLGANATMFGIVDRILLSPPEQVRDADALRLIYNRRAGAETSNYPRSLTFPDYEDLRDLPAFSDLAAYTSPRRWTLGTGAESRRIRIQLATASYFPTLGVQPRRGRFYDARDDTPGAPLTAVISERFWKQELAGDPAVVGRVLAIRQGQYEIIGVAPRGFTGAEIESIDVWLPLRAAIVHERSRRSLETRTSWWIRAVARLAPGIDDQQASVQMTTAHHNAHRRFANLATAAAEPSEYQSSYLEVNYLEQQRPQLSTAPIIAGRGANRSTTSAIAWWLAGVSLMVLLIACANVTNLLLARGVRRRQDTAIHVALGIDRFRLISRSLIEASILSALGAIAALGIAYGTAELIGTLLLPNVDLAISPTRLLTFVALASVVTAVLASILPAIQAGRATATHLRSHGSTGRRASLRGLLMVTQTTLSVVLLVGAGLFVRSLWHAAHSDVGFDHDRSLLVRIEYRAGTPDEDRSRVFTNALDTVRRLPGVESAALATETVPLHGYNNYLSRQLRLPDRDVPIRADEPIFRYAGTERFLETLGIRATEGRLFDDTAFHTGAEPVIMVSRSFADRVWPRGSAVGACLHIEPWEPSESPVPCRRIVGVFEDLSVRQLTGEAALGIALPSTSVDARALLVRTDRPNELIPTVHRTVTELSSAVRYVDVSPMSAPVERLVRPWQTGAYLFVAFGALALLVAAIGLYSVLAFDVAQRRTELGIRAALGAVPRDLVKLVAGQSLRYVVLGLVCGGLLALATGPWLADLLFDVQPNDPVVFASVAVALVLSALVATIGPAQRATATDPAETIRAD
ncbi:MAG: ADOP family duplicated permease [Acidobacteriota bacterium]